MNVILSYLGRFVLRLYERFSPVQRAIDKLFGKISRKMLSKDVPASALVTIPDDEGEMLRAERWKATVEGVNKKLSEGLASVLAHNIAEGISEDISGSEHNA